MSPLAKQQSSARPKKQSTYGLQLREKQKTKEMYGLREKQFKLTYLKGQKKSSDAGESLLRLLEMRLDNVIYRFGLAITRAQARQMVSHAQFLVNDQKVNIPSYQVKPNDVIAVRKNKKEKKTFVNLEERLKKANIPGWLNFDPKEMSGKILGEPKKEDLDQSINSQLIVEFYSR
ncbi:MAG: 30S ribosomal protein S4 [Candidatus Falkowbacteria bacterium]|nr:30S ribosomal protein S4 [Candidatus Falkowbacteria bacterium]